MIQQFIRPYNNQTFSVPEAAAWLAELDKRTKSNQNGYNSISELADRVQELLPAGINLGTMGLNYIEGENLYQLLQDIDAEFAQIYDELQFKLSDAPNNTNFYGRKAGTWAALDLTPGDNSIANSKLEQMSANTIKGRIGTDGNVQDLTKEQVKTILDLIPQYLTINAQNEIDLTNSEINHYNFENPANTISFSVASIKKGGKAIVRTVANTSSNPETVVVTGTGITIERTCTVENWEDNEIMEIHLHAISDTKVEWWYYTKER